MLCRNVLDTDVGDNVHVPISLFLNDPGHFAVGVDAIILLVIAFVKVNDNTCGKLSVIDAILHDKDVKDDEHSGDLEDDAKMNEFIGKPQDDPDDPDEYDMDDEIIAEHMSGPKHLIVVGLNEGNVTVGAATTLEHMFQQMTPE